ncbi:MAG: metallophosphoesterase family protein [Actinobacteria bacterium]|nr:metallophosphoesterase family protein [Actinomycetota bacterium]
MSAIRRLVVLSDTHFGHEGAVLSSGDKIGAFLEELSGLDGVDALVLLGDVWDLWWAGLPEASRAGERFFRALGEWAAGRQVFMVPGNHDFHLVSFGEERRQWRRLGWEGESGEPSRAGEDRRSTVAGVSRWMRGEGSRVCGLPLQTFYPFLHLEVGGRTLLLMHGHHLDFFTRSFWWAKTAWLAHWVLGRSRGISLGDLDRLNRPFFELLTSTARVPELLAWEYTFYRLIRFSMRLLRFQSKKGASPGRFKSVVENAPEVRELLKTMLPGHIPDLFVFGHTHRAGLHGMRVGAGRVLLANCGCWLEDGGDNTTATYLVIDEAVRLRRLGDWEVSVRP